jgi:hypothetical protein
MLIRNSKLTYFVAVNRKEIPSRPLKLFSVGILQYFFMESKNAKALCPLMGLCSVVATFSCVC